MIYKVSVINTPQNASDCRKLGLFFDFFSGGGPPNPPHISMYLYHTIPQIYSKDILDFAIKTLKKIAFKNLIRTSTECSRLQEKGVNLKKKNPGDRPANMRRVPLLHHTSDLFERHSR